MLKLQQQEEKRTIKQNSALHLWFDQLSEMFIDNQIDMKMLLSEYKLDVPVTPEMVKEYLWRRVQVAMYGKKSTTELTKKEVTAIYDVINRFVGEKWKLHVPFPSREYNFLDEHE